MNVHGDVNRNLGQDQFARLHIYPNLEAADNDVSTSVARMVYIASTQNVWFGRPGAWVAVATTATNGSYDNTGDLPLGALVNLGDIESADTEASVVTFVDDFSSVDLQIGNYVTFSGSLDDDDIEFLEGSYPIISFDNATRTIQFETGIFGIPSDPVQTYGTADVYVGAPKDGEIAIVHPDPLFPGLAIWLFNAHTNTWVRHTDQDPRIILNDASRAFLTCPAIGAETADPTTQLQLTPLRYVWQIARGYLSPETAIVDTYAAGWIGFPDASNTYVGKRLFVSQGNANDGYYAIVDVGTDLYQLSPVLPVTGTGAVGFAIIKDSVALTNATESQLDDAISAITDVWLEALGSSHNIQTTLVSGQTITELNATTDVITFDDPLPPGITVGDQIEVSGTAFSNVKATIIAVTSNTVSVADGIITTTELAVGTANIVRGWDHSSFLDQAHIDDAANPHAAAGYLDTAGVDARISVVSLSAGEITAEIDERIELHDIASISHAAVEPRVTALEAASSAFNTSTAIDTPVELNAVAAANGIPLTMVSGIWTAVANNSDVITGILEKHTATSALGTCTAEGSAVDNSITVSLGLTGSDFEPGLGYTFAGLGSGMFVIDHIDGNILFCRNSVPTSTVGPGIAVVKYPKSRVILSGRLSIPNAAVHLINAPIESIIRTKRQTGPASYIKLSADYPVTTVAVGDQITVSTHTRSPYKNGTYTVANIDVAGNALGIAGFVGSPITGEGASVVALTQSIVFDDYLDMLDVSAGQTLTISGSGAGNDGTYTIFTVNQTTKTVTVTSALVSDESGIVVTIDGNNLSMTEGPDFEGYNIVGVQIKTIMKIDHVAGEVWVMPGSVAHAAAARSLVIHAVTGDDSSDGSYTITAVTPGTDYDIIEVTGLPSLLTRPLGQWGTAATATYESDNVTEVDVDDGTGNAAFTFAHAVVIGVVAGDILTIEGTTAADGQYTVHTVVSTSKIKVVGIAPGTDQVGMTSAAGTVTRSNVSDGLCKTEDVGSTTAFASTTPSAPTQYYVDTGDAQKCSTVNTSASKVGYQIDKFTFIVRIP